VTASYDGLAESAGLDPAGYLVYPLRPLGRAVIRRRITMRPNGRSG